MAAKLIKMCTANYPSYGESNEAKGMLWMQTFQKESDELMQTAIISCLSYCKKFPTIAEIREAIKDLRYEEQVKPKQLAWDVKRTDSLHQKIMDMATGKTSTKKYLSTVDITKLAKYARRFFPNISDELILKNYPELSSGLESENMCWECKTSKQACNNVKVKHELLNADGWIKNTYAVCENQNRR